MNNDREEIQIEATKTWIEAGYHGTLVIVTGLGKSKIACDIAGKQLENGAIESVLVVVPTTNLIEQWYEEFLKWKYDATKIDFMCIQSAHKLNIVKKSYDLLIIDEIHTALSDVYSNVFLNVEYKQLLGLTATVPESPEARQVLADFCPIIYEKTLKEIAAKEGIIAKTTTYNLPVKFNRKDKARYNTFNEQFHRATLQISIMKKEREDLKDLSVFDIAKEYATKKVEESDKALQKQAKAYWSAMTMRKWICYGAESKINVVKQILEKYPERKWILFNKSIKFAEQIAREIDSSKVYHSKMKKEDRERVLKEFTEGLFKHLIAVDALNAGLNIPDIDSAICISGVSTELVTVQQQGLAALIHLIRRSLRSKDYGNAEPSRRHTEGVEDISFVGE